MVMFFVICFVSFPTFPENCSFPSAFVVCENSLGGSGGSQSGLGGGLGPRLGVKLLILAGFYRHNCTRTLGDEKLNFLGFSLIFEKCHTSPVKWPNLMFETGLAGPEAASNR